MTDVVGSERSSTEDRGFGRGFSLCAGNRP